MTSKPKASASASLEFRVRTSNAGDELMLTREEVGMLLDVSPGGVSNMVSAGRLIPPTYVGGGVRALPRWRLGDIRALLNCSSNKAA